MSSTSTSSPAAPCGARSAATADTAGASGPRAAKAARSPQRATTARQVRRDIQSSATKVGRKARGDKAGRTLVPRTRSSHYDYRESDCELRVQSGTRIIELLVSFDSEARIGRAARFGELRNRDTRCRAAHVPPQSRSKALFNQN